MNLVGSHGIVLSNGDVPSLATLQTEIDRRPCLFAPQLVAVKAGTLACLIRVHDQVDAFGYESGLSREVLAAHAELGQEWSRAHVFRDDVAEAAARSMGGDSLFA